MTFNCEPSTNHLTMIFSNNPSAPSEEELRRRPRRKTSARSRSRKSASHFQRQASCHSNSCDAQKNARSNTAKATRFNKAQTADKAKQKEEDTGADKENDVEMPIKKEDEDVKEEATGKSWDDIAPLFNAGETFAVSFQPASRLISSAIKLLTNFQT